MLLKPPVTLATVAGFLLIGACAAVEVGVVATFEHGSIEAGLILAVFAAGSLFLAGVGVAPALAVIFAITTASVKFSETPEAFGWTGAGQLIGAAAGSAIAGFLVDGTGGAQGAYLAATLFAVAGVVVSIVFVRAFPDLRHRDPSPYPDTEPVQVTPS